MWLACRFLLLVFGILALNFHLAIHGGEFAEPLSVAVEGLSDAETVRARLFVTYVGAEETVPSVRPGHWECPPRCIRGVAIYFVGAPPTGDGTIRVRIGDQSFTRSLRELHAGDGYWVPDDVVARDPPGFAMCRNWPGMRTFVAYYAARTAPGLAIVLLACLPIAVGMRAPFRAWFEATLGLTTNTLIPDPASERRGEKCWNLVGLLGLVGGFIGLQIMQPYYFTQDDALVGELPGILLGCRSLWQGTFPDWNPYVFMGAPLATIGFWAITYPPQLISYAIARHVLNNEFATMEVFAALHLLVGFMAMRHLSRCIGMGAMTGNLAALSFVFAGCILIMGRSWHAFIANAVWLPLLGIAIQRFREGPVGWKWIAGVGLVLGLSYHAGFPQIVAILGMFFVVGVASVTIGESIPWRRTAAVVPALLLGIGLSAPLLLHHLQMTGGHERFVPTELGVYDALHAAVLPYPLAEAGLPTDWGSDGAEKMGHFYFFGGVFAVLFLLQSVGFWICFPSRHAWARAWWVPSGIFALLMVLGEPAGLWTGFSVLPMSKFFLRYSFRFYPWLAFCAILSGGLVLERLRASIFVGDSLRESNTTRGASAPLSRRASECVIGIAMLAMLAWHLAMCQPSFYNYGFRPYPELPTEFESVFHPHVDKSFAGADNSRRVASWYRLRSTSPDYYLSLPLNLPHYYQVPSIFGYDPVVEGQPRVAEVNRRLQEDPVAACKAYGVGWHLFSFADTPAPAANGRIRGIEQRVHFELAYRGLLQANLTTLARHGGTTLKELPGVDPLAFETRRVQHPLPMHLHCRGADIDVSGLKAGAPLTINFLSQPHIHLYLDGQPLEVEKDGWQRITTTLPAAGATLSLRFEPPWHKTCAVAAGICLAGLLLGWVALRFRER